MPPKRKNDAPTTPKPAKKAKTSGTPTRTSPRNKTGSETPPATSTGKKPRKPAHPGSKAVKAPDEDANFEWEILDGDERSTLVVGEAQPKRLTLTFHHRHDKNEKDRVFTYDRKKAKEIDWNNKDHIRDINKWRNQIFVQNMKFTPKVTHTPWAPFETAYLELFHEKLLEAATGKTDTFVAPHNELIYQAFNDYFEGRTDVPDKGGKPMEEALGTRPPGGLNSYLNRADTKIRGLRDRMKALEPKLKKSKKEDAWMPDITDEEIQQYIDGEWESAVDTAPTAAASDADGEEDEDEAEEEDEDEADEEDDGNVSDGSTLTTPPDTDEELESMEILEREQQAKRLIVKLKLRPSTASKFPGSKRPTTKPTATKPTVTKPTVTKPTVTKPTTTKPATTKPTVTKPTTSNPAPNTRSTSKATSGRSSARSSSPPPRGKSTKKTSPAKKTMTDSRKTTEAPETPEVPEPKGKPRWVKPAETAVIPDSPEVFAAAKKAGWKWSPMPKTDEEALELHRASKPAGSVDNTWNHQAIADLDKRIKRNEKYDFNHEAFNSDLQEEPFVKKKAARREFEDWHEGHAREDGAAAVTGLLNTADVPPLGYMGDLKDLVTKKQLPEDELVLAESRDAAIKKKDALIERKFRPKKGQLQQRNVMSDSESTGDESVDDEDESEDDDEEL
ncbi:hypothetical protein J4E89_006107 [Alternaria sp. Ai002NY15]|nr:hypothetical protein J4E89_006107 [Alternaria sp. Ai002NY15]